MSLRASSFALALVATCLAGGCATPAAAPTTAETGTPAQDPLHAPRPLPPAQGAAQTLSLGMGQPTRLADGSQLTYTRLVDDSRCPAGVQCVWEGSAEIALRWQPARGGAREFRLHTSATGGPTSAPLGERMRVVLVALERGIAPRATVELRPTP